MFRFSVRELLVFTALAAVAVAWWIDRNRIARIAEERDLWTFRAESIAKLIRQDGGQVEWNDDEIIVCRTDSAGRRMIMIPRNPYPFAPALVKTPPGVPVPVRMTTRPDSSNRTKK